MARKDVIPNLENALESGFSELKTGEGNIKIEKPEEPKKENERFDHSYGMKINAEENRGKFISKPIKATKQVVEKSIEFKEKEPKNEQQEIIIKTEVLDTPSSKIGDDFDVSW
ncbi:MAG: hypothetical protein HOI28_07270 [Euryarchaeota archaeon]|jgi:hypothetical protein|nr:hypothetical protein [Euryarchaeota archaeon]MBT5736619.1 hypothetical protein [Euryarchaeota archaeon]